MSHPNVHIELNMAELRAVARFAVDCAEPALTIFERAVTEDPRPREAVEVAREFAAGAERSKAIRDGAWAAHRAYQDARDAGREAASEAARAAVAAASAAFLHPIANDTQVLHILGAAGHAARAHELDAGDDRAVGDEHVRRAAELAGWAVLSVLRRYPDAPAGRGRAGELMRALDVSLRSRWGSGTSV